VGEVCNKCKERAFQLDLTVCAGFWTVCTASIKPRFYLLIIVLGL